MRQGLNTLWTQLPRYWIGFQVGALRPEWNFLRDNDRPHVQNSNTEAHQRNTNIPRYYEDLVTSLVELDLSKLPKTDGATPWTSQNFYTQFMAKNEHSPKAFTDFWSVHHVDPAKMWLHIYSSYALGVHQDIHFRFLHRILPTNAFMRNRFRGRGFRNLTDKCPSCPTIVENIQLLFFRCTRATPVLNFIYPTIQALLRNQQFKIFKLVLNNFPQNVSPHVQKMVITIIQIAFHVIWTNRNKKKFENVYTPIQESQNKIIRSFAKIIREKLDAFGPNNLLKFRQVFCHTPQFCDVLHNDRLKINFL